MASVTWSKPHCHLSSLPSNQRYSSQRYSACPYGGFVKKNIRFIHYECERRGRFSFFFFLPLSLSLFRAKYEKLLSTVRVLLFQVSLCAAGELPSDSLGFIVDTVMDGKRNAVDETLTVKFNQRNFLHRVFI